MERYINSYATSGDVQTALDNGLLGKPYVAYVEDGSAIDWNTKYVDYSKMYLTFNIISGGTINWTTSDTSLAKTISYSKDNGAAWTDITSTTAGTSFNVNAGDKVMFKGDNAAYGTNSNYNSFNGSTALFEVYGNIMSLIDSTGYTSATTFTSTNAFNSLFKNCTGLTTAENLILPATTLKNNCYVEMFYNCTSLTTAPELPATALTYNCYSGMFYGCTSLTTAPELPATTLVNYCYIEMFKGCSSLNYIKCLATNISAVGCISNWVSGVSSTGTFVKKSGTSWSTGNSGIPSGWTVIEE